MDADVQQAVEGELRLLLPEVRGSAEQVEALLHPEFVEVGASGRLWDRAAMVSALVTGEITDVNPIEATEVEGIRLADDVVLVRYVSKQADGNPVRRSSLWRRHEGRWQVYYHQGTPAS